jgi:hypothetical protein
MQPPSSLSDELILEDDQDEAEPIALAPEERRIFADSSDPTITGLYDRYKDGDLVLQPDFQRYFVWDMAKSSRLVESVILDIPIPIIYLAQEPDGREAVIDGQQRLTAFFEFLDGNIPLTGLRVCPDLNNKRFSDLDRVTQNKLRRAAIRTITIRKESSPDLRFEIFERLNTGSAALNDQELRNCVYRGTYNALLRELAADRDYMTILGLTQPDKRMRDVELVLRFAAFYHATYLNYHPAMKRFLNQDMERFRAISPVDADKLQATFKNACQLNLSMLGKNCFKRFYSGDRFNHDGYWEPKKFNASLYDVLMWGFTRYDKPQVIPHLDALRESLIDLMTTDQQFIEAIELSTSSAKMVTIRFDK